MELWCRLKANKNNSEWIGESSVSNGTYMNCGVNPRNQKSTSPVNHNSSPFSFFSFQIWRSSNPQDSASGQILRHGPNNTKNYMSGLLYISIPSTCMTLVLKKINYILLLICYGMTMYEIQWRFCVTYNRWYDTIWLKTKQTILYQSLEKTTQTAKTFDLWSPGFPIFFSQNL